MTENDNSKNDTWCNYHSGFDVNAECTCPEPNLSEFLWKQLPTDPPTPSSGPGHWEWLTVFPESQIPMWVPTSPRTAPDQHDPDTPASPYGGSRARQLGMALGRILGTIARGIVWPEERKETQDERIQRYAKKKEKLIRDRARENKDDN